MNFNGLEKFFKTNKNGEIIDFLQINKNGYNPLIFALIYNKTKSFNLDNKQFDFLIKNSNLSQKIEENNITALILAIRNNKSENLNLNEDHWDYLIKENKISMKIITKYESFPLKNVLKYHVEENIKLNSSQWRFLIENSDESLINDLELCEKLLNIKKELNYENILNKINQKDIIKKNKI